MSKLFLTVLVFATTSLFAQEQTIKFEGKDFELKNVTASVTKFDGKEVLKVERDLKVLPFDVQRLESTVDE